MSGQAQAGTDHHCFDLVRTADKDRFLSSLFAPDGKRDHLYALYAFNIELARIRETVSEPALGEIRLQWWADAIADIRRGTLPGHPVARALAGAIQTYRLPHDTFLAMIEARRFDLYDDPMPSLNDLEGYLGETSSALMQLAFLVLDATKAASHSDLSGFAGVAMGMTGILRSLPIHCARGQCYIPRDLLEKHGINSADLMGGRNEAALSALLTDLRGIATRRYDDARAAAGAIPIQLVPALLPATLVPLYLGRLERLGVRSLTEIADVPQWRRQWHLFRQSRKTSL